MGNNTLPKGIKSFLTKLKSDFAFKTMTSAVISFSATVLFSVYNGYLGIRVLSVWHGSICLFYLLLAAIRGIILISERNAAAIAEPQKSYRRQRTFKLTSVMLLVLNLTLIAPVALMVVLEKPVNIGSIPAIAMAAYTTYKIAMASIRIKKRKHNNILVAEMCTINFIDALVSVLTLQNTLIMVNRGKSEGGDMLVLTAVSSAAIYLFIIFVTVRFLLNGINTNNRLKNR